MRVAVINEISAASRNPDILDALKGRGFEVLNLGNTPENADTPLQYIHTGLMAALTLHLKIADFIVGGCGTGIGFLNSVMQYPGVTCGHILSPLDAWLFARINAGNCVSLALNQGYGWAGEINLKMIFDELFTTETGSGFPSHRAQPQKHSREMLANISSITHRSFPDIIRNLPQEITRPVMDFAGFHSYLLSTLDNDSMLREIIG
jgi:ribose 5-phosphate isomerase RpiB